MRVADHRRGRLASRSDALCINRMGYYLRMYLKESLVSMRGTICNALRTTRLMRDAKQLPAGSQ